jgi:hypothetical protein
MDDTTTKPGRVRAAKTKQDQVNDLLAKTVENGCTIEEEKSSVQLAYQLSRQYKDEIDQPGFIAALYGIGDPARYAVTDDGFLVPAEAVRTVEVEKPGKPVGRIRALCEAMIMEGIAAAEIAKRVREQVPGSETSPGCVSWYASKMRKRGIDVPKRGQAPAPAATADASA